MAESVSAGPGPWYERLRALTEQFQQPAADVRRLLQEIVALGCTAVGAAGAAVLVPDEDSRYLRFFVAHGPASDKLVGLLVPIEGSIAGYVYSTDQMTALGDLEEEKPQNYYAEISKQIGVATRTYLALPILLGGHARGVATYVNRPGGPPYRPFQPDEMEHAQSFAVIQAVALRHLDHVQQLGRVAERDFATALAAIDPMTRPHVSDLAGPSGTGEPWTRILQEMEGLPTDEQAFCAELVSFVARWRGRNSR